MSNLDLETKTRVFSPVRVAALTMGIAVGAGIVFSLVFNTKGGTPLTTQVSTPSHLVLLAISNAVPETPYPAYPDGIVPGIKFSYNDIHLGSIAVESNRFFPKNQATYVNPACTLTIDEYDRWVVGDSYLIPQRNITLTAKDAQGRPTTVVICVPNVTLDSNGQSPSLYFSADGKPYHDAGLTQSITCPAPRAAVPVEVAP